MAESPIFMFDDADPIMQEAYRRARATFKYFWRELSWEYRRIIPALEVKCVKAAFCDGPPVDGQEHPAVEQMWLTDVDFDGEYVSGELLNQPNWLTSVNEGDQIRKPLNEITDWLYAISGIVFGGFTVNLIRARMSTEERTAHDDAWGLDFGDPRHIRLVPQGDGWPKGDPATFEHPMSENMASALQQKLVEDPSFLTAADDNGWTFLHNQSLAGSAATVKILLDAGANPNLKTKDGKTPLALARSLGWDRVVALLVAKGAT